MSDKKTPQDWSKDWQAMQRQYWNAWSDATRNSVGEMPSASTPWHEGIDQWSQMFSGSGKQSESTERVLGSAKAYVAMMQSLLSTATGKNADGQAFQTWIEAMRNGFNLPGMDAAMQNNPLASMLSGISGPGVQGFDQLSAVFAPMLEQARAENLSWLRIPAFGYSREQDEEKQQALLAFADYQRALRQYNALILKSSQLSFGILETKLAERAEPGRQIESMRALYDLWVDAAEEAYAQVASSEEFRKAYGELVDAQMRVRASMQKQVERVSVDLGMPTRTELNSVHRRLHDLRRGRGDASTPAGTDADELRQLRDEVEALKRALGTGNKVAAAKSATRKAVPKRAAKPEKASPEIETPKQARFNDAISNMRSRVTDNASSKSKTGKPTAKTKVKPTPKPKPKPKAKPKPAKKAAKKPGKATSKRGGKR